MEINEEKWVERTIKSLQYNREDDIRMYLIELIDMNWVERKVIYTIGDQDFNIKKRINYMSMPLYQQYIFNFINSKVLTMDRSIELMETVTSALERLKDDGYMFRVLDFIFGTNQAGNKQFRLMIYHKDDIIDWEKIFTI